MPTSVAHVTNHRTISRLRQFNEASVMRITLRNHKKPHVIILRQRMKTNEQYIIYNMIFPLYYIHNVHRYFYNIPCTVALSGYNK